MMNNTNNTSSKSNLVDDPSEDFNGYAYYSVGLSLGFLFLMTFIALSAYYCSQRNLQNTQTRPSDSNSNSSSNNSHRTVIIERDSSSAITIQQQEAILNNYPVLLFSQAKLHHKPDSASLSCSICLADYKDSEWLRILPDCGHFFHRDCIDMWLRLNLSCPMCRNSPFTTPLAQVAPLADSHSATAQDAVDLDLDLDLDLDWQEYSRNAAVTAAEDADVTTDEEEHIDDSADTDDNWQTVTYAKGRRRSNKTNKDAAVDELAVAVANNNALSSLEEKTRGKVEEPKKRRNKKKKAKKPKMTTVVEKEDEGEMEVADIIRLPSTPATWRRRRWRFCQICLGYGFLYSYRTLLGF